MRLHIGTLGHEKPVRSWHIRSHFDPWGIELYRANNPETTGILSTDLAHFDATLSQRYPEDQYPNEVVRSKLFQADAVKFIRDNPWRFAQLCAIRFIQFWKLYSPRVPLSNNLAVIASFGIALPFF
jgi:hypothetical protein